MNFVQNLDFFQKIQQDQPIRKTISGGVLFLFILSTIILLIFTEFYAIFIKGQLQIVPFIDNSNFDERVRVNINITLHQCPCSALALDLQDVTGAHLEDVKHTLNKIRVDFQGNYIDKNRAEAIASFEKYINYPSNPVFRWYKDWRRKKFEKNDCYGAQLYDGQKCITCQDVMSAYSARGWPQPPKEAIDQCMPNHRAYLQQIQEKEQHNQRNHMEINNAHGHVTITIDQGQNRRLLLQRQKCDDTILIQVDNTTTVMEDCELPIDIQQIDEKTSQLIINNKEIYVQNGKQVRINQRMLFTEEFGQGETQPQFLFLNDIVQINAQSNEGCQLFGNFFIKKVPGNFHISFHGKGQAAIFLNHQYSIKHTIHLLEFTSEYEELSLGQYLQTTNTLDQTRHDANINEDLQYYIKLVTNTYSPLYSRQQKLYSFTSHQRRSVLFIKTYLFRQQKDDSLPQIIFKYEFDPIAMHYYSKSATIFDFLVSICAIVGGVYAVGLLLGKIFERFDL